jgi:hypothetical protein
MTYLEARNSGHPFNRKKYKDGWYVPGRDGRDNALQDLSQRFWKDEDLEATDWCYVKNLYGYTEDLEIVE